MHVASLAIRRFRNLDCEIPLCSPLTVLLGENNVGKSNVIHALRLLFEPDLGPRGRRWVQEEDFAHDGRGHRIADDFEIEGVLHALSDEERARMVTCLAPSLGTDVARLRLRATLRANGRVDTEWFGGDSEHADVERWARSAVTFTYLQPLRDAAADLRPGRHNRLIALLNALAPEGHADRAEVEKLVQEANHEVRQVNAIVDAEARVGDRLSSMTGGGAFTQQTRLDFDAPLFERIAGNLRAWVGHLEPLEMDQNGLGYNNLLYMAVLLAALADSQESALHVLLVEEPEAHLHPQLQDLLMRYLESLSGESQQVVVTSHSPHFASAARVERMTVLTRSTPDAPVLARAPRDFDLDAKQLGHLRRFLDVTKSALLFARSVILVEGIAEQLLVPQLARRMGRPLPPDGVAVIGIGGVAFPPFAALFGEDALPLRVSVVSDSDLQPAEEDLAGADPRLSPRAQRLLELGRDNVLVSLAPHTLEWDLVEAGNWDVMVRALSQVKPRVAARLQDDLADANPEEQARHFLERVEDVKGQFAQELADLLQDDGIEFEIPAYLREAIEWVTEAPG